MAVMANKSTVQSVMETGVKRPEREADILPLCRAEVENVPSFSIRLHSVACI
jgi:hypothetical protein